MKTQFNELIRVLQKCKQNCPWLSKQTMESYSREILAEAEEVVEAIEKRDFQNLKEELGDLLWDTLVIAHIAEEKGLFKVKEIMSSVVEKMKRRKPYIFEGRKVSEEEAHKIWFEAKEKEKR